MSKFQFGGYEMERQKRPASSSSPSSNQQTDVVHDKVMRYALAYGLFGSGYVVVSILLDFFLTQGRAGTGGTAFFILNFPMVIFLAMLGMLSEVTVILATGMLMGVIGLVIGTLRYRFPQVVKEASSPNMRKAQHLLFNLTDTIRRLKK